jgi:phosphatidylinositol alpha-1,6-mannosyltransferase
MSDELVPLLRIAKVITVPNGVDLDLFRNNGQLRKRQIIAVGHLKWQKGYEYLLEAVYSLVTKDPEIQLLIAGSGELETKLRSYAASLGLENNVRFLGTVPQYEIVERLNESRIFVMASVSEGFPKALLEAMACGVPAVVTDVGECGPMVDGAGCVVPAKSPDALAAGIHLLLCDEAVWQKSSERAVNNAQQYSWDESARRTFPAYTELLSGKQMPGDLL